MAAICSSGWRHRPINWCRVTGPALPMFAAGKPGPANLATECPGSLLAAQLGISPMIERYGKLADALLPGEAFNPGLGDVRHAPQAAAELAGDRGDGVGVLAEIGCK